jgi:hypothetical protein
MKKIYEIEKQLNNEFFIEEKKKKINKNEEIIKYLKEENNLLIKEKKIDIKNFTSSNFINLFEEGFKIYEDYFKYKVLFFQLNYEKQGFEFLNLTEMNEKTQILKEISDTLKQFCFNKNLFLSKVSEIKNVKKIENSSQLTIHYDFQDDFINLLNEMVESMNYFNNWTNSMEWNFEKKFSIKNFDKIQSQFSPIFLQFQKYFSAIQIRRKEILKTLEFFKEYKK